MARTCAVVALALACVVGGCGVAEGGLIEVEGFRMGTGAVNGYVLTCDANGVATWQPAPGGGGGTDNDWTIVGVNMYATVSGNVGIGVTNPTQRLDVLGTVQMTGFRMPTGATNGYVLASDASGAGTWRAVTSAMIQDGTIVDADIAAAAAIAPSKIAGTAWTSTNDGTGSGLDADLLDGLHASAFAASTHAHFGESWTGSANRGLSVSNSSSTWGSAGICGEATDGAGVVYGVYGKTVSTSGRGVYGLASATSGSTMGVSGQSDSTDGLGVYGLASAASGATRAVFGQCHSGGGSAIFGTNSSATGRAFAIRGENASTQGTAVSGWARASSGTTWGVEGTSDSPSGAGVYGQATATMGQAYGVHGLSASATGCGVYGEATATSGGAYGVRGISHSWSGAGVRGEYVGDSNGVGVYGYTESPYGTAVMGYSCATTGNPIAVYGITYTQGGFGGYFTGGKGLYADKITIGTVSPAAGVELYVQGDFQATGTKSFVQQHPKDPTKEIVYVALEGPEAGTYVRGTAELKDGEAAVALPEHFALVTGTEGLTVQLTPVGQALVLYVVEESPARLVVREASGKSGRFNYLVQGIRKGYEDHQVVRDRTLGPRDLPPRLTLRTERERP